MDAIKKKMQAMKLEKDNAMDRALLCEQQARDANLRAEKVSLLVTYFNGATSRTKLTCMNTGSALKIGSSSFQMGGDVPSFLQQGECTCGSRCPIVCSKKMPNYSVLTYWGFRDWMLKKQSGRVWTGLFNDAFDFET
jgi:hypothetical protein